MTLTRKGIPGSPRSPRGASLVACGQPRLQDRGRQIEGHDSRVLATVALQ